MDQQNKLMKLFSLISKERPSKPSVKGFAKVGLFYEREVESIAVYVSETVDMVYVSYYPELYEPGGSSSKLMCLVFSEKRPDISPTSGNTKLKDSGVIPSDFQLLLDDNDVVYVGYHTEPLDSITYIPLKDFDEKGQNCISPACEALLKSIKTDFMLKQKMYFE